MTLDQVKRIAFSLLLLAGTLCLDLAAGDFPWSILVAVLIGLSCWLVLKRPDFILPDWLVYILGGLIGLLVIRRVVFYDIRGSDAMFELCHLILLLQFIRLFGRYRDRHFFTGLVAFTLFVVSARVNTSPSFLIGLLLFALTGSAALFLVGLGRPDPRGPAFFRSSHSEAGAPGTRLSPRQLRAVVQVGFGFAAIFSFVCLCLAFVLFFLVPRPAEANYFNLPFWGDSFGADPAARAAREIYTGFSGQVDLNQFGQAKQSFAQALIVEVGGGAETLLQPPTISISTRTGRFLWRGLAFRNYRGGVWARPVARWKLSDVSDGNPDGWSHPPLDSHPHGAGSVIRQKVTSHVRSDVLFGLAPIGRVRLPGLIIDETGGLSARREDLPPALPFTYTLDTPLRPLDENERALAAARADTSDGPRYQRVPPRLKRELRVKANQMFNAYAIAVNSRRMGPYQKAQAIEWFFKRSEYSYTLDIPDPGEADPVHNFIFKSRRGHCGLFASAMVLLLRTHGIPARLVAGYAGGVYHKGVFRVTQADAHAWVEVRLEGFGWVPFDPTGPDDSPRNRAGTGAAATLGRPETAPDETFRSVSQRGSWLRRSWHQAVVGYNAQRQRQMFSEWGGALRGGLGWPKGLGGAALVTVCIAALALAGLIVHRALRHAGPRREKVGTESRRAAERFYREMLAALSRRGFVRQNSQTPREFSRLVLARSGDVLAPVGRITRLFEQVRYGELPLAPEQRQEIKHLLARLRETPKGPSALLSRA